MDLGPRGIIGRMESYGFVHDDHYLGVVAFKQTYTRADEQPEFG